MCWKLETVNLLGEQHGVRFCIPLRDVRILPKYIIAHVFSFSVRRKSVNPMYFHQSILEPPNFVFTSAISVSTLIDVNKWANHINLHLYVM
jgi:hypothetical protein